MDNTNTNKNKFLKPNLNFLQQPSLYEHSKHQQTLPSKPFNSLNHTSSSIEYDLNNWNLQLNNTINKLMESSNNSSRNTAANNNNNANCTLNKRALTPITDTSEEESNGATG